ncbi:MAG TPA: thiamine pyrophosphate-binding protein [Acidimicrobiales bacterium]|nr:thiamine pyrophosphate-binding protein [Acidimicrobiales bacterium]
MNGAESFVEALVDSGVTTFFGLPGSTEAPLLEAIRAAGAPRYVLSLHEGATVAMADGYARVSGSPGVVGLHTTVGTMNGMSQLFNAYRDQSPVVMTAGHKDRAVLAEDAFCATPDLASLLRGFTKSAWQTLSARSIGADLRRALQAAMAPPRGPAFLALPEDLMVESVDADATRSGQAWRPTDLASVAAPAAIRAAVDLLASASAPLLVAGSGALGAAQALLGVARDFELPLVYTDFSDLGSLPYSPCDARHLGLYGEERSVLDGCDLVLAVGSRVFYPFSDATRARLPPGARLVHVTADPSHVGRSVAADLGLVGDVGLVLDALAAELAARGGLDPSRRAARARRLAQATAARGERVASELAAAPDAVPLAIERLGAELNRVLPDGVVLVDEGVRSSRRLLRYLRPPEDALVLRTTGGSLGWGVPAAIGAKLAAPSRPVVAVVGDGSLHFSVQAIWSAVTERAPVVVVVLDNGGYLAVKRAVEGFLGVARDDRFHPGTELPGIDHVAVATGYGATGVDVGSASGLAEAVRDALAREQTVVIRVPVVAIRP